MFASTRAVNYVRFLVGMAVFTGVWVTAGRALACSCAPETTAEGFTRSVAVFEGRVLEVAPGTDENGLAPKRVHLSVVQTWKGANQEELWVTTPANDAACGYPFEANTSYLVYASNVAGQSEMMVSLCSRTAKMSAASEDLATMGAGVTPVSPHDPRGEEAIPSVAPTPSASGCASCAVGAGPSRASGAFGSFVALVALLWFARRSRAAAASSRDHG